MTRNLEPSRVPDLGTSRSNHLAGRGYYILPLRLNPTTARLKRNLSTHKCSVILREGFACRLAGDKKGGAFWA